MSSPTPVASVVILAWRLVDQLEACVRALRAQEDAPAFEIVIVVNGASPEVVATVEAAAPDVLLVSETNLGYGGGCDAGIRASHGRYVVLLNDDAVPEPRWLRSLVDTAETDEGIAAVASLLLNPDRTIQEAGSRVLANGRTVPIGVRSTLDEARAAGLLDVRDIDYGSGAGLLVRRAAYDAVGGFDARYQPAYYEDADLELRLQVAGGRIVFQPAAVAVHAANSSTSGHGDYLKFLSERGLALFRNRWHEVLEHSRPESAGPLVRSPIAEYGVAERPAEPVSPSHVVHPDVVDEYADDLLARVDAERERADSLETALTTALAETERVTTEHAKLQAEHHQTVLAMLAAQQRVAALEESPLRTVVRKVRSRL